MLSVREHISLWGTLLSVSTTKSLYKSEDDSGHNVRSYKLAESVEHALYSYVGRSKKLLCDE